MISDGHEPCDGNNWPSETVPSRSHSEPSDLYVSVRSSTGTFPRRRTTWPSLGLSLKNVCPPELVATQSNPSGAGLVALQNWPLPPNFEPLPTDPCAETRPFSLLVCTVSDA